MKKGLSKKDETTTLTFNARELAELAASLFIGHVSERTGRGLDADDAAFVGYSERYKDIRTRTGRNANHVDLTMSGAMLAKGLSVVERRSSRDVAEVVVGLGTGTSPAVTAPPKSRRNRRSRRRKMGRRKGGRSAPHNVIGAAHQLGLGHLPVRRWFGLSPSGRRYLLAELARAGRFLRGES